MKPYDKSMKATARVHCNSKVLISSLEGYCVTRYLEPADISWNKSFKEVYCSFYDE